MAARPKIREQDTELQHYLDHIAAYEREFKTWEGRGQKILKRYRDESRDGRRGYTEARFNILWSNVQTLKAATYSRVPKPDVSRRFRDQDPVGRVAALLLERALEFEIQHYPDYRMTLEQVVLDRFLPGRGTSWVRYEPHFQAAAQGLPEDGAQVTEDADNGVEVEDEVIEYECAPVDYVHWRDFGHSVARTWEEVSVVWRRVYLTRQACIERFGEELGRKIPLDAKPEELKRQNDSGGTKLLARACVYEVWDKEKEKAYWISKSLNEILDVRDDPLELEGFFPCPRPIYSTITTDSLIPLPDFTLYQDQANELDLLCDRIDGLVKALQVKGVYDAATPELGRLFSEGENGTLIPVKNFAAFAEKQGLRGSIDLVDITPLAAALQQCYAAMEQIKGQIYEITGISDIVRGITDPNETLGAQQMKGQYASIRLKEYQNAVARMASSLLQLKAQIMCRHFTDQTLLMIGGAEQLPEVDRQYIGPALQLLRNEPLKTFRIEVAADSLVQMDEQAEKQGRMEFLGATGTFLEKVVQAGQVAPQIVPLLLEMLKFGVRGFPIGKTMEGIFESATEQAQQAQQPAIPPEIEQQLQQLAEENKALKQGAELEKYKVDTQAQTTIGVEKMKLEHEMVMEDKRTQNAAQLEQFRAQTTDKLEEKKIRLGKDPAPDATERAEQALEHFAQITAQLQQALTAMQQTFMASQRAQKRIAVKRGRDGMLAGVDVYSPEGELLGSHSIERGADGGIVGVQ